MIEVSFINWPLRKAFHIFKSLKYEKYHTPARIDILTIHIKSRNILIMFL